jgi:CRP-like cAMP-binding protein
VRLVIQKDLSLANRLISALPTQERGVFLEHCELIELKLLKVVQHAGAPLEHAYFPMDSFVSVVLPILDAPDVQVALVGNEGMVGTSLVLGLNTSALTCKIQRGGRAFCIHRTALQHLLNEDPYLRDILLRYVSVRQTHLAQQAACLNYHSVEQRLARWLLMARDRAQSSEVFLTHQVLAGMLGVRRESVTRIAGLFETRGLISYSPGYVMLLDEDGLLRLACSCYQSDLLAYERALGDKMPEAQARSFSQSAAGDSDLLSNK